MKEWHATVSQRKNQEWLILQIVRPDARTAAGSFFAMKGSVLDRIKADFNLDKRDRLVSYGHLFVLLITQRSDASTWLGQRGRRIQQLGQNV